MNTQIEAIKNALASVGIIAKSVEHWRDNLFTVKFSSGSDVTFSVNQFDSHRSVSLFCTYSFTSRPFVSCILDNKNTVIAIDGEIV